MPLEKSIEYWNECGCYNCEVHVKMATEILELREKLRWATNAVKRAKKCFEDIESYNVWDVMYEMETALEMIGEK